MIRNPIFRLLFLHLLFFSPYVWAITNGQRASDLIGQLNENNDPVYTKAEINDGPSIFGLTAPVDVAIDSVTHRIFITDTGNNRILVYNLNSSNILEDRYPDYVLGQPDFYSNGTGTSQSEVRNPRGLAYDHNRSRLFVSDSLNNRVLVFDVASITNGENAVNVLGQENFSDSTGTVDADSLGFPYGLAYDYVDDHLYVIDSSNERVMIFDTSSVTDGEDAVRVLGQANFTTKVEGQLNAIGFHTALAAAIDPEAERFYATDFYNHRVMVFDITSITNGESAVNVLGQANFTSSATATTQTGLSYPVGLGIDTLNKRLFVSDYFNRRVMVFDVTSITDGENAVNVLGQNNFISNTHITPPNQMSIAGTAHMRYDTSTNRLYVIDNDDNRLAIFDAAALSNGENMTDSLGQINEDGTPNYTKEDAHDGPNRRGMRFPGGIALDSTNHRLFVADQLNHRVLVYNLNTRDLPVERVPDFVLGQNDFVSQSTTTTQNHMYLPFGIAFDSDNNRLFVSDSGHNRVMVFDTNSITNGENASFVLGQPDFVSDTAGTTQSALFAPEGLAYDSANQRLFVTDGLNHRILVFDVSTVTNGENATHVLGQPNFTSNTPGITQNTLSTPYGVAYHPAQNKLYVTEFTNARVTVFDVADISNGENAVSVLGQTEFTSNGSGTTQSKLSQPVGLTLDLRHDLLFVSQYANNRVSIFNISSISDGEDAIHVLGQENFTNGSSAVTQNRMKSPIGLAYNAVMNTLYVGDALNNRVMLFNLSLQKSDSVKKARAYPNPFRPSQGHTTITLDRMPPGSQIKIFTVTGALTRELRANDEGHAIWDVKNTERDDVVSGVYFGHIEGDGGDEILKLVIQR